MGVAATLPELSEWTLIRMTKHHVAIPEEAKCLW